MWLALVAALAACASDPPNVVAEGSEGALGVRQVLLCPLNLVLPLRPEIRRRSQPVDDEIVSYLESLGRQVSRLGFDEGQALWQQARAEATAAGERSGDTPEIFVASLAQDRAFDAVVMPSLILHETQMDAGNASWDGVTRRMRIINAPSPPAGRNSSTLSKGIAFGGVSGPAWVTSLHVLVFARDGRRVFEGRGGLEFLYETDLIDEGKSFRYALRPNRALFLSRTSVREGIEQAFRPYLVAPEP